MACLVKEQGIIASKEAIFLFPFLIFNVPSGDHDKWKREMKAETARVLIIRIVVKTAG